jgi:hypothetical protein
MVVVVILKQHPAQGYFVALSVSFLEDNFGKHTGFVGEPGSKEKAKIARIEVSRRARDESIGSQFGLALVEGLVVNFPEAAELDAVNVMPVVRNGRGGGCWRWSFLGLW